MRPLNHPGLRKSLFVFQDGSAVTLHHFGVTPYHINQLKPDATPDTNLFKWTLKKKKVTKDKVFVKDADLFNW
eukprot:CAMPEP_0177635678 /NCGR_PEP_ID=MMETSP0447-20121125/4034_1 /TAXON_ID=0 /ORGANISM="Stygamoeba regulata, Strain BSH-02190019" /LENGTH=72 /DNA_ID=CAMNT_0019137491 /DNA_START=47 /DNA_END=262 /DNA_ORIENTATION=-